MDEELVGLNRPLPSPEAPDITLEIQEGRKTSIWKIVWSFLSFLISVADVAVILWLSYLHFSNGSDIMAWLMLLPILLNFVGIFTFISNVNERRDLEELGCKHVRDFMFFPVIGPAVSSLRLFVFTCQENNGERAERLESLITKMKQYESFFRAAPEAFIQITFRIVSFSAEEETEAEDYWTWLCIFLCLFTLAESNMFGSMMPYYRMFVYAPGNSWSTEHIPFFPWKVYLFVNTYLSIGSRIFADAIFKSTIYFHLKKHSSFGEILIICFVSQFALRTIFFGIYHLTLGASTTTKKSRLADDGIYAALTYAWRSLFLAFDFQAHRIPIFLWFYVENLLLMGGSYAAAYLLDEAGEELKEKYVFHIYAGSAVVAMIIALALRFNVRRRWHKTWKNHVAAQ